MKDTNNFKHVVGSYYRDCSGYVFDTSIICSFSRVIKGYWDDEITESFLVETRTIFGASITISLCHATNPLTYAYKVRKELVSLCEKNSRKLKNPDDKFINTLPIDVENLIIECRDGSLPIESVRDLCNLLYDKYIA